MNLFTVLAKFVLNNKQIKGSTQASENNFYNKYYSNLLRQTHTQNSIILEYELC